MAIVQIGTDLTSPAPSPANLDFIVCDLKYGRNLLSEECYQAANTLPRSNRDFPYPTAPQRWALPLFQLPITINQGGCYISVEVAGPSIPAIVLFSPNIFRTLAAQVIQECVDGFGGMGGFSTHNLGLLFGYLLTNEPSPENPIPGDTAFVTLTVSGPEGKSTEPGNTDPAILAYLADLFDAQAEESPIDDLKRWKDTLWAQYFRSASLASLGTHHSWVLPDSSQIGIGIAANEMSYECDASLGAPLVNDCSGIEWGNELGPDSDTISVGPAQTTFLHRNSCYVAISASIALVLTWAQVRVALSALITTCVQNPFNVHSQGGRAFHMTPIAGHSNGRKKGEKKKKRDGSNLSGLNALPPHANLTVFQQNESWTSAVGELNTCTWNRVVKGLPVSKC